MAQCLALSAVRWKCHIALSNGVRGGGWILTANSWPVSSSSGLSPSAPLEARTLFSHRGTNVVRLCQSSRALKTYHSRDRRSGASHASLRKFWARATICQCVTFARFLLGLQGPFHADTAAPFRAVGPRRKRGADRETCGGILGIERVTAENLKPMVEQMVAEDAHIMTGLWHGARLAH